MRTLTLLLLMIFASFIAKAQVPDSTWWSFSYPEHRSLDSGLLNLRYLNEEFAGKNGFIKTSADGNSFVNGKGDIRFWACNGGNLATEFTDKQLDSLAKFLAKMGVNLIRYHGAVNPKGKGPKISQVDTVEVNNIWRCVAAMKKQGIYTVISPFWPHNGHMGGWIPKEWGIEGYSEENDLWAVLFFNERLKQAYKSWVKYLYTAKNPYTGIALKDDPAVAIIQVENEDAVFFWTIDAIKPTLAKMIGTQFFQWLTVKYGSLAAIQNAWKDLAIPKNDDLSAGVAGLYSIYEMTVPEKKENAQRLRDQTEFFADKQHDFYAEMVSYYRNDLGCKQLINGNNWRTASQSRLLDLERWTNTPAEVIAVNKYFDPQHTGPNSGWRIDPGDFYISPSALKNPADLPANIKHVAGHPMIITESGWNLPNKYQTEAGLLMAAYGGLSGLDAFFWFTPTATMFAKDPYFRFTNINGQHPLNRWSTSTPGEMGMFPANALIQRLGYVKESTVVREQRTKNSMVNRAVPQIFEEQPFDPNRDEVIPDRGNEGKRVLSPLTFLTGGVVTNYEGKKDTIEVNKLVNNQINTQTQSVTSITGQQQLDYKNGIFILNTPNAKAVSGFLSVKKKFDLDELIIISDNTYATIEMVSMDGLPLNVSGKILLQIGTLFRPTGWKEETAIFDRNDVKATGFKITNTGTMPWLGMPAKGSILLKNKLLRKATQLDAAGYGVKKLELQIHKDTAGLVLPANAYYILLEK